MDDDVPTKTVNTFSPQLQPGLEVYEPTSALEPVAYSTLEPAAPHYALEHANPAGFTPGNGTAYSELLSPTVHGSTLASYVNSPGVPPTAGFDDKKPNIVDIPPTVASAKRKRKRRLLIILAVVTTVVIITLAVVLGVVLGRKSGGDGDANGDSSGNGRGSSSSGSDDLDEPPPPPPPDPTTSPEAIRMNSGLGVAGWISEMGYSIRVFFQDNDDNIRMSSYDSWLKEWTAESRKIETGVAGSSIAAAHLTIDGFDQTNVYFMGDNNCIQEYAIIPNKPVTRGNMTDVCDAGNTKPHETSRLAIYFPSLFFQDEDGLLNEYAWGKRRQHKIFDWGSKAHEDRKAYKGKKGTALAMFVASKSGKSISVLYQNEDEIIAELQGNGNDIEWKDASTFSDFPPENSIGGLSYLEKGESGKFNRHVLYQNANGVILQHINLDDGGWIGPRTDDAFKGALKGTEIACISAPIAFDQNSIMAEPRIARCYFQLTTGHIREIQIVPNDSRGRWSVLGTVPP